MADDPKPETDEYYIPATASFLERRPRILKQGDTFAVLDHYGDARGKGRNPEGIFHLDTRHLSRWELRINSQHPLLLGSTVTDDNDYLVADMTSPDIEGEEFAITRDVFHLFRTKFLWQGACYEQLRVDNFTQATQSCQLTIAFDADFSDLFEVRGMHRESCGTRQATPVGKDRYEYQCRGIDQLLRTTTVVFDPIPDHLSKGRAEFSVTLKPGEQRCLYIGVFCTAVDSNDPLPSQYERARDALSGEMEARRSAACRISSDNELFDSWVHRSLPDLHILCTNLGHGLYPYAGIPWYSAAFGRDGVIAALHSLWLQPEIARGVLGHLAATQAESDDPNRDSEPGKILHEMRHGEMARLGEVPFSLYYGAADATALFVVLARAYFERTGDLEFVSELAPHIERALRWIEADGDRDGDGFVEYHKRSQHGLDNQGWKDSPDSVFHSDGTLATGPIALCEVQAYVYAAFEGGAELAETFGQFDRAEELHVKAEDLRRKFEESFWCEDLGTYALALDGQKRLCRVRTSNAGHALYTGIADPQRARRVAQTLMSSASFSGWGIRTVASGEGRYNPASYHNGSVWPHDNALIAEGLVRYGMKDDAIQVFTALFEAAVRMDLFRLPELFCGFRRRPGQGPTLYPVACAPQAWASTSVFALLRCCLGLEFVPKASRIVLRAPRLPEFLDEVLLEGLRVGDASADLALWRRGDDVAVHVVRRKGGVTVVAEH